MNVWFVDLYLNIFRRNIHPITASIYFYPNFKFLYPYVYIELVYWFQDRIPPLMIGINLCHSLLVRIHSSLSRLLASDRLSISTRRFITFCTMGIILWHCHMVPLSLCYGTFRPRIVQKMGCNKSRHVINTRRICILKLINKSQKRLLQRSSFCE